MLDTNKIVHSLSIDEVKEVQDTFFNLFLIIAFHKNPDKRMRHLLQKKRNASKGIERKVYKLLLTGSDLKRGTILNVDLCIKDYYMNIVFKTKD